MKELARRFGINLNPMWLEHGYDSRFQGFQNLMRYRIRNILLVSSMYDLFVFEEDGRLYELIRHEYQGLNLSNSPEITRVSSGKEALQLIRQERRYDLVITTQHIDDMHAAKLAERIKESVDYIPVVLLAYNNTELKDVLSYPGGKELFTNVFIWTGDFRIIIAIVKQLEDRQNVENDTKTIGVQSILLVEDNVSFYSSYLPMLYSELLNQSKRLIDEGINLSHRFLRMRARPKILLCSSYEDAWDLFTRYQEHLLGVISDIDFFRDGVGNPNAGIDLAINIRALYPTMPILLQSTDLSSADKASQIRVSFALKDSPTLLNDVRKFVTYNFGFGAFEFTDEYGHRYGQANDLIGLEDSLHILPQESLRYHSRHHHFSTWLKARTEFWLAHELRKRSIDEFTTMEELRNYLVNILHEYRMIRQRGIITDFRPETYEPQYGFSRIGGGSLGGKARGLSFVNMLINNYRIQSALPNLKIFVPPCLVIGTDVFDAFIETNNLRDYLLSCNDDRMIDKLILSTDGFSDDIIEQLTVFLNRIRTPLAVRSSSLLEDSQFFPFAGIYDTFILPNGDKPTDQRLNELLTAIKMVYASTYHKRTKDYIKLTTYRLEEEKMAVIVQQAIGSIHEERYYPDFSGIARSYNSYPIPPQKNADGIAAIALGFGKTAVDGGRTVRFCPKYPNQIVQFETTENKIEHGQTSFFALDMNATLKSGAGNLDSFIKEYPLTVAEGDGVVFLVGSNYSKENEMIEDTSRPGLGLVNFSRILNQETFPLPQVLELLLEIGSWGMGTSIEMEFVGLFSAGDGEPQQFGILQMRPLVLKKERPTKKSS